MRDRLTEKKKISTCSEKKIRKTEKTEKMRYSFWLKYFLASSVSSSSFEDVDEITKRMFTKISQTTFTPEFECLPHYIKPTFHASCTRQHVCGIMAI